MDYQICKMIAQAVDSENYTAIGLAGGDQTGTELNVRQYYDHPTGWGKVYRLTESELAHKLAEGMRDAVTNGFIGYSGNSGIGIGARANLDRVMSDTDVTPAELVANATCDCSGLVYAILHQITGVRYDGLDIVFEVTNPHAPHVRNFDYYMEVQLPNAGIGVEVFTIPTPDSDSACYSTPYDIDRENLTVHVGEDYADYLTGAEHWQAGDIIRTVTPSEHGHMGVWV